MDFKPGDMVIYTATLKPPRVSPDKEGWVGEVVRCEEPDTVHVKWITALSGATPVSNTSLYPQNLRKIELVREGDNG